MSLVNDMLRDLEGRRAGPAERLKLDGLLAADEAGAARRKRFQRIRSILTGLALIILIGLPLGVLVNRLFESPVLPQPVTAVPVVPVVPAAPVVPPVVPVAPLVPAVIPSPAPIASAHILDVLPQNDSRGLVLQLLLDRSVPYQRIDESGAVTLSLPGVQLSTQPGAEMPQGRLQREGRSLSWRVQAQGQGVQVLLVGLGDNLQVRDRLEPAGDHWLLWIEVPMSTKASLSDASDTTGDMENRPATESTTVDSDTTEAPLPAWANARVPAEAKPRTAVAPAIKPVSASGPPQMKVIPYQPDALALALQTLQGGDYPRAVRELQALQLSRGNDLNVVHGLARAYLANNQQSVLLTWLPAQLKQWPNDSELRLLLARSQLQSGDARGAVATLEQNPPPLAQELTYHALLAASYQQTAQWQKSAALYEQLIKLRPNQATWQLGLAIALERLDQSAAAALHYRAAQQGQGLDDGARRFASDRAVALGGQ